MNKQYFIFKKITAILFCVAFLFCFSIANANTIITSKANGNWSNPDTWTGGVVPGDGDTVIINNSVNVDVDTVVGSSPATGNYAILIDGTLGKTGYLIVSAGKTLTVKGDIWTQNAGFILGDVGGAGGAHLQFVNSANASYKLNLGGAGNPTVNDKFISYGTAAQHSRVDVADINYPALAIGKQYDKSVYIDAVYTDFYGIGDATCTGYTTSSHCMISGMPSNTFKIDHSTFDKIGMIYAYLGTATADIEITNNKVLAALGNPLTTRGDPFLHNFILFNYTPDKTTGARKVWNNSFALPDYDLRSFFSGAGWDIQNNIFNRVDTNNAVAVFQNNFIYNRHSYWSFVGYSSPGDTINRSYVAFDTIDANTYPLMQYNTPIADGTVTFDGYILDASAFTSQIMHNVTYTQPTNVTTELKNAITLPMANGEGPGGFYGRDYTADGKTNVKVQHSTITAGNQAGYNRANSACYTAYGTPAPQAGFFSYCKNNLVWSKTSTANTRKFVASADENGVVTDTFAPSGLDYNAKYNLNNGTVYDTNLQNGVSKNGYNYLKLTDQNIGTHDVNLGTGANEMTSGPQFVDSSRNLATFDTAGLNHAVANSWQTGVNYSEGDIVSAQTSNFYGNVVINFRCVKNHISDANDLVNNGKPGVATNYRLNWEFVSAYDIRQDTSLISTLYDWVKAGFAVRNSALANSADDGTVIGAGDFVGQYLTSFVVQKGLEERSYIRNLDLQFANSNGLADLIANKKIKLTKYNLDGTGEQDVSLAGFMSVNNNQINIDFGAGGIGGNYNDLFFDGYYKLSLDLDNDGIFETEKGFFRILGDINGDGRINIVDFSLVRTNFGIVGMAGTDVLGDANDDGRVNITDFGFLRYNFGKQLSASLQIDN